MIQVLKILWTADISWDEWRKFIGSVWFRIFLQCVMTAGISPIYITLFFIPGVPGALCKPFKREITATTTAELPCCELTATQQETTTLHRQHVGPLGWVPSGEKKKKGGEGWGCVWRVGGEREKRTELKWNVSTLLGKMSPAPHWSCPDSLSHLCSLHKRRWAARGVVDCVTHILSSALHSSAITPASLHSSPWSSVLCRGGKDEQICLESCPWAIPVASATIWTVSPVYLCLFHVVFFFGPDYDTASLCSGVKVLYCFSGGFKEMRKNLPFLLGKIVCKHLGRILLGFLNRFLGLGWAQSVS